MNPERGDETKDVDVVRRLSLLLEISKAINHEIGLRDLLMTLTEKTTDAVGGERGAVFLYDRDTDELWSIVATGETGEIRFPADKGVAGYVAQTLEPVVVPDTYADPRFNPEIDKRTGYRTRNIICSPIQDVDGDLIGVVQVINKRDGAFLEEDMRFLDALGSHAAVAIRNARLFDERKKMFESLIDVLADSIESRDPYTAGHSRDVMRYSVGIAGEMGLDDDEVEVIKYAALLHDYGKIGIPDEILRKPDILTRDEYEIIKQHVVYTREILGKIAFEEKLRAVPEIAGSHHERLSGCGYPQALENGEIPVGGRIISVADTFQALTSDRPYHKAIPAADAMAILEAGVDVEYDGDVVRALKRYLVKQERLAAEFDDAG